VPPSTPTLRVSEIGGRVRLGLDGFGYVEGETLQDAADELVARLLSIAMVIRSGGVGPLCSECCPDLTVLDFVWQLGELAAAGGDPRELLFGPSPLTAA
jgi:hypothetical protein